jgi:putative membrane protein (TIGR04086 family)
MSERLGIIAIGIFACIGVMLPLFILFSAITVKLGISSGILSLMASFALGAGCFSAAFYTAKRRRKKGLVTGFICGITVFVIVFIGGIIFVKSFSAGSFIAKTIIILTSSAIGGILGVNSRQRFR